MSNYVFVEGNEELKELKDMLIHHSARAIEYEAKAKVYKNMAEKENMLAHKFAREYVIEVMNSK